MSKYRSKLYIVPFFFMPLPNIFADIYFTTLFNFHQFSLTLIFNQNILKQSSSLRKFLDPDRSSTTPTLHRTLDWASCFKSGQVLIRFLHSLSTVRLHVSHGLPFLHPIPSVACLATEDSYFRRVCPIQPHLYLLICCISAIFNLDS